MQKTKIDISEEFLVYKFNRGIKLVRPEQINQSNCQNNKLHSVGMLLDLPLCIFFDNTESVVQRMSDMNAEFCGFNSALHSIGKTLYSVFKQKEAYRIAQNDQKVMLSNN